MTDKPTITQADRDAAIDLAKTLDLPVTLAWLKKQADKPHLFSEAFANHREAAVTELQAEVERMRKVLGMAANQFRYYEQNHRLKGTSNGAAKAETNKRCAEQCEAALAQKKHAA